MPHKPLFTAILLAGVMGRAAAQVDCDSERGVLALMTARVVVGSVLTLVELPTEPGLPFQFTSELFRARQDSATHVRCLPKVSFQVYVSRQAELLGRLPDLAAANPDFTPPKGVSRAAMRTTYYNPNDRMQRSTYTPGTNAFYVHGGPARNPFTAGSTVHYRFAKRITRCSTCRSPDPMVFSETYSLSIPQ